MGLGTQDTELSLTLPLMVACARSVPNCSRTHYNEDYGFCFAIFPGVFYASDGIIAVKDIEHEKDGRQQIGPRENSLSFEDIPAIVILMLALLQN